MTPTWRSFLLNALSFTLCSLELLLACALDVGAVPVSVFCHYIPSLVLGLVYSTTVIFAIRLIPLQ